ncbi:MAG: hypothetical protein JWN50_41 [Parcubacteria group bacterium]|nr:hypothetical protein [Parcubacteria group bacterium]
MATNKEKMLLGAAVAALAAGAYFFNTTEGKKHAKKMKGWMVKMKGEVLEKIEDVEEVTEPVYREIVDTVANAQILASKIPRSEILALATDLKRQWNSIKKLSTGKTSRRKSAKSSKKSGTAQAPRKRASKG